MSILSFWIGYAGALHFRNMLIHFLQKDSYYDIILQIVTS